MFQQYFLPHRTGFDSLTIRSVPKPSPKHGQILVQMKAVSLNWRDGIIAKGTYPFPGPDALVPGSDGAGIVEEVGEGVTAWQVGDRVLANFTQGHIAGRLTPQTLLTQLGGESQGLLGEYFIFPQTGVVGIPEYLSFEEASCLPCAALTAWNALYGLAPIRPGQTVLLQGTGGVSTFGLQIAAAAGATTIVTSSSDGKLAKAQQLGATHTINYRTTPDWAGEVKRITNGRGADHIIEVGGTLTLQASFDAVAMHGIIHCIGHITNPDPLGAGKELRGPDAAFLALDRLCILRGVVVGSREQLQDMLEFVEARSLRPVIDRVFNFQRVREAYEYFSPHPHQDIHSSMARRKKCVPNTFPVCGACKRLNLECVREPTRQVLPTQSRPRSTWHDWLQSDARGQGGLSRRRHAMNFYISVLSQLLSVSDKHNSFLSAFLPMAIDSAALAHAIVSWSSGHLSALDNAYSVTALEARSASLRALADEMHSDDIACRETNAATSLVLLASEVCLGDYNKWYSHLHGVKQMILSSQAFAEGTIVQGSEALKRSPEGRWVLRNFAYHDVIASVTLGQPPLLDAQYLQGITDVVDTYIGLATHILAVISEISCLDSRSLAGEYASPQDVQDPGETSPFRRVEEELEGWSCAPGSAPDLRELAYAYRDAALIFLYRWVCRAISVDSVQSSIGELPCQSLKFKIQDKVASALEHIATIPQDGGPDSAILFPLFLAGAEAIEENHIAAVRKRLALMADRRPFHNIQRAGEILGDIWMDRHADANADWQTYIDRRGGWLLLT
ncbi:hypothetical protein BJX96DRAFT_187419 [Aspergillus floccosus]